MCNENSKPKYEIYHKNIEYFLREINNEQLLIPHFQREYDWKLNNVIDLLNSIVNSHPIGTIIIWNSENNYSKINLQSTNQYKKYILDGQQRLRTLKFLQDKYENKSSVEDEINKSIDLEKIFFNKNLNIFCKKGKKSNENLELLEIKYNQDFQNLINNTKISVIELFDSFKLDEAIEIFAEINNSGKKLTEYNIIISNWFITKEKIKLQKEFDSYNYQDLKTFKDIFKIELFIDCLYLTINENEFYLTNKDRLRYCLDENYDYSKFLKKK